MGRSFVLLREMLSIWLSLAAEVEERTGTPETLPGEGLAEAVLVDC